MVDLLFGCLDWSAELAATKAISSTIGRANSLRHGMLDPKIAASHSQEPNVFTPSSWRVRSITSEILDESGILNLQPSVVSDPVSDREAPSKILLISNSLETDALFKVQDSISTFSTATFSKANYLEILPAGVNKAKGLKVLGKALGLDLSQIATIGDAPNDLEMLRESGLAIAMGNASSEVKEAADWIVGTNDEGGVGQAIRRLLG